MSLLALRRCPLRRHVGMLALIIATGLTAPALADEGATLGHGLFLVATEHLANTSFQDTVIFVTHATSRGTLGVAVNRATAIPLKEYLPDVAALRNYTDVLYLGGPVQPQTLVVLMQTKSAPAGMQHIAGDIFFSTGIGAVAHGASRSGANDKTRAYAGYTSWAPGQLEREIARGDWRVVKADPALVFSADMENLHRTLLKPTLKEEWI